jgi:hypothetical protein
VGVQKHSRGDYNEGCAGCVHGSGGLFGYLTSVSTQLVQATINRSSPLSIGSRSNAPSESVHSIDGVRRFAKFQHREIAKTGLCFIPPGPPPYKGHWFGNKQIHGGVFVDKASENLPPDPSLQNPLSSREVTVIPYIGPEIVEALRARQSFSELARPVLPKRSAARQNTSEPIPFPHMLSSLCHSNALVAVMGLVTRWLL